MEDETETTRNGRSDRAGMGWDRVGWARRQTGKHEDATSERTVSSSVSQSATDLTWMENRPLSRLDVKLVSGGADCRHAVEVELVRSSYLAHDR